VSISDALRARLIAAASALMLIGSAHTAGAVGLPAPGAVTPQTVKLPDGPASVRGLANDATVSAFTGQVSYEIPIDLPAGPGGQGPKLALSYNGALGNGPLGIGWGLGQVQVRRSLRLGVPTYTDADELELVGLGGPTLVSIGNGQYRAEGAGNSIRGTAVNGGFELIDAAGTHYQLGTSDQSRLENGSQVAAWYLEKVTDVAGHVISYTYSQQNGQIYLSSIAWGGGANGSNVFSVELDYETRPDTVVSWRTGFRIADSQRLTALKVWSFGAVRHTVQLTYDQTFALSRLHTITVVGSDGTASPTTTLTYAAATPGAQAQPLGSTGGWTLGGGLVSFFDVDNDGAMDLINIQSGHHSYRRNLGGSFGPEVMIGNAPALSMSSVRMLDLDGDSGAEMVSKSGSLWRSYRIVNNAWVETDWPGSSTIDPTSVAVADLNGDNRMDALAVSGSGIVVWMGTANGFAPPVTLGAISPSEPTITPNSVQFADVNGDGLADVVSLGSSGMIQFRGRGNGTFERVGQVAYPWTGTTDVTQLRLADLDRDGLLDLVRVTASQVIWYRGKPDGTFSLQPVIVNRPAGTDANTMIQLADANGNGSTDIVWSSPNGMWVLDLAGPTNAGLLVGIDNGLGKVEHFGYTASTQLAWNAATAGMPWATKIPMSIAVTTTARKAFASGDPDRTTALSVRDGIYEEAERRFVGFAQSTETFLATDPAHTVEVITTYPGLGAPRVLRGQVLTQTTEDGVGNVLKLVENQVNALAVTGLPDDPRLERAAIAQTQTTYTAVGDTPAVVRTRFQFDGEGREIEEDRDGRVVGLVALDGDESIIRRTYTSEDATTGVRDLVCEEDLLDGAGNAVSQTHRLYGDDASVAADCQPGKGWQREQRDYLASEARWVSSARTTYDAHGNPLDKFSAGVDRTLTYDDAAIHPILESVSPAAGQTLSWVAHWDNVNGTLISSIAPNGVETDLTYDGLGRLTSIAANGGLPHTYYRYTWAAPRPLTETFTFDGDPAALAALPTTWTPDSGWRRSVEVSNSAGEQIATALATASGQWNVSEYRQYDSRGRVASLTSPFVYQGTDLTTAAPPTGAATQTVAYDALDRIVDQALPNGDHRHTDYHPLSSSVTLDGLAPVVTVLDGQNRTTHTKRTVNGTVEAVDADYDAAGRVLHFRLQGGQVVHTFTYDSLGRLTSASDPDVGLRTLQYDDNNRLRQAQNAAGNVISYGYDGAGRLLSVDSTGLALRYHYDAGRSAQFTHTGGQLAWAEESTGSVDFGYDALGRLATMQRTIDAGPGGAPLVGGSTTQFSLSGLPRSIDFGDGVVVPLHYDAAGRLSQIDGVWSVTSYDAASQATAEQFANGVTQQYERDLLERPSRVKLANSGGAFYDVTASYTPFGAIKTLTDNDGVGLEHSASFGFDVAGRLTSAVIGSAATAYHFSYAYDGLQNMIQRTASGPSDLGILTGTYQYRSTSPRQLDHITNDAGNVVASFQYDGAGREIQHGDKQLAYDALSNVVRVDGAAGSITHAYGYDGTRVMTRSAAGDTTYFLTPDIVVHGDQHDHYVSVGDRVIAKLTTSSSGRTAGAAAAGLLAIGHGVLGGLTLLAIVALLALTGVTGRARRLRFALRSLRGTIAGTLASLVFTAGCGGGAITSHVESALTGTQALYFHKTYTAGPDITTDAAGQVHDERRTEPFGAAIDTFQGGAVHRVDYHDNPLNALNKLTDPDTGWSYHGARWLTPDTAQWNAADPVAVAPEPSLMQSPWSLNPYQYVMQNPVAFWDPDGRDWREWASAAAGAFVGGVDAITFGQYSKRYLDQYDVAVMNNTTSTYTSAHTVGYVVTTVASTAYGAGAFVNGAKALLAAESFSVSASGALALTSAVAVDAHAVAAAAGGGLVVAGGAYSFAKAHDNTGGNRGSGSGSGSGRPPKPSSVLTSIRSFEKRLAEHQAKLAEYIKNPYAFDNKGFLARNAGNPEVIKKIIEIRIGNLEAEIRNFQNQIEAFKAQVNPP
jgi:RHS repeat-associated protein